jgi:hypothetical protein
VITDKTTTHIGDGVYARFDGWQIVLSTERVSGIHWVALEPEVLRELIAFAESHLGRFPQAVTE